MSVSKRTRSQSITRMGEPMTLDDLKQLITDCAGAGFSGSATVLVQTASRGGETPSPPSKITIQETDEHRQIVVPPSDNRA